MNYQIGGLKGEGYFLRSSAAFQMPWGHLDSQCFPKPSCLPCHLISSEIPHRPCYSLSLGAMGAALHAQ